MTSPNRPPGALVPAFASPLPDPPLPEVTPDSSPPPASQPEPAAAPRPRRRNLLLRTPATASGPDAGAIPKPEPDGIRTDTSLVGKPTIVETARLVAGLLGLVAAGAALLVQVRGRTLRRPSKDHLNDMARPLARIGLRHVDTGVINADLIDVINAGTVLGDYLTEGPLTSPGKPTDAGVPADLQQEIPQ